MDENKNGEMSVDELLEKLKASLQADEPKDETPTEKVEDDEIKKAVASAIGEVEEPVEEPIVIGTVVEPETQEEPEVVEVAEVIEAVEEALEPEEPQEAETEELSEELKEETPVINDDDIFAAWGIDRTELSNNEPILPEETGEVADEVPYEPPTVSNTKVYYIARIESKEGFAARKQSESQQESVEYDRVDYSLIKQALGIEKAIEKEEESQEF